MNDICTVRKDAKHNLVVEIHPSLRAVIGKDASNEIDSQKIETTLKTTSIGLLETSESKDVAPVVKSNSSVANNPKSLRARPRESKIDIRLKCAKSISDDDKAKSMSIPHPSIEQLRLKCFKVKVYKTFSPSAFVLRFDDEYRQLFEEMT